MPDWVVWSQSRGFGIVEAKGSHSPSGPGAALTRAYKQAERAEITARGSRASFKRYAIVTRWGFATPTATTPMLAVRDPQVEGDKLSPEDNRELAIGIARLHCASLLRGIGLKELSDILVKLAKAPRTQSKEMLNVARAVFEQTPARHAHVADGDGPSDDLVGGFVTRNGPIGDSQLSARDQRQLARLMMAPTFVGIEREHLQFVIDGRIESFAKTLEVTSAAQTESPAINPRNDGAGSWIIRIEKDKDHIE